MKKLPIESKLSGGADVLSTLSSTALLASLLVASATANAAPPNIVFILSDDQGWTNTSVQIDPDIPESKSDFYQTPNLEALAAQGMRFTQAYSAPACSMTRVAIQTGKSSARNQLTDVVAAANPTSARYIPLFTGQPLSPPIVRGEVAASETLIPEWLGQNNAGYTTAHFGKYHIGNVAVSGYDQWITGGVTPAENPKDMFRVANRATQFMQDRVTADQPFFMQVSFAGPHAPFEARAASLAKYQALAQNLPPGTRHTDPLYAAMLEDLDTATGQIIDKITQLGIQDNTYIVYASDNGAIALLGSDESVPLFHSKGSVYEGGVRVPLFVTGPGVASGVVSRVPVMLQDLFATISDIADVTAPLESDVESASLLPLLHNGGQLPNNVPLSRAFAPNGEIFQHVPHYTGDTVFGERVPASSVLDGDYKLVRIYGTPGNEDTVLLFNLAQNITESSDANSPLNLANVFPEKKAELLGKLNKWLSDVDASLPYDMATNADLEWDAAQPGVDPTAWRSTTDVGVYFRERWETIAGIDAPALVRTEPHQPRLGSQAFHFDGNDKLGREFFRVSDSRAPFGQDSDRSATMEFWVRLNGLDQDQILFESGDGAAGLSLTLGDANGDGSQNDLRFRVLGKSGQSLTATVPIDAFADPTKDFVQASAVINDDNSNRYIEIYINGALAARVNGTPGAAGTLEWDIHNTSWLGYQHAGLGGAVGGGPGNALGGNAGTGDLPFAGNFEGDIAAFNFYNYVLNSSDIASRYNAVLDPAGFGIGPLNGAIAVPAVRPVNVSLGTAESNSVFVVEERHHRLASSLSVDAAVNSGGVATPGSPLPSGSLAAGTDFISYLLQFDPTGSSNGVAKTAAGSVTFAHDIVALMLDANSMASSDSILGSIGDYGVTTDRGLQLAGSDFLSISADRRTLSFNITVDGDELAQFRVLTQSPIAGDFNGDGIVNGSDLNVWRSAEGLVKAGDADGDSDTDGNDFLIWQRRLGSSSSTIAATSVPEPSAAGLLSMAVAVVSGVSRRARRRRAG